MDYEFGKQITLIFIPIVIGIFTSKWLTSSYQQNKERSDIKRRILSEFTESYAKKYTLIRIFRGFIIEQYTIVKEKNNELETEVIFPENTEKPLTKYNNEWKKFVEDFATISFSSNVFWRSLIYYYNDENLQDKVSKTSDKLYDAYHATRLFCESDTVKDFHSRNDKIDEKLDDASKLLDEVEAILNNKKIK